MAVLLHVFKWIHSKSELMNISNSLQQCGLLNSVIYVHTLKTLDFCWKHAREWSRLNLELCKDMYKGNINWLSSIWKIYLDYTKTKYFNFSLSKKHWSPAKIFKVCRVTKLIIYVKGNKKINVVNHFYPHYWKHTG